MKDAVKLKLVRALPFPFDEALAFGNEQVGCAQYWQASYGSGS